MDAIQNNAVRENKVAATSLAGLAQPDFEAFEGLSDVTPYWLRLLPKCSTASGTLIAYLSAMWCIAWVGKSIFASPTPLGMMTVIASAVIFFPIAGLAYYYGVMERANLHAQTTETSSDDATEPAINNSSS